MCTIQQQLLLQNIYYFWIIVLVPDSFQILTQSSSFAARIFCCWAASLQQYIKNWCCQILAGIFSSFGSNCVLFKLCYTSHIIKIKYMENVKYKTQIKQLININWLVWTLTCDWTLTFAPVSTSISTTSAWPANDAIWSAVFPFWRVM